MSPTKELQQRQITLKGIPASPGIAIGEAVVYKRKQPVVQPTRISQSEIDGHLERFQRAKEATVRDLNRVRNTTADQDTNEIIATQIEIVNDPDLADLISSLIEEERYNVAYAVYKAFANYINAITTNDNDLLKDRIIDIEDMRDRLIHAVRRRSSEPHIPEQAVVVTDELTPSEVVRLAGQHMKALVMDSGGLTSHTSIIAHSMDITSVVGLKRVCQLIKSGDNIVVDGNEGMVVIRPTEETLKQYNHKLKKQQERFEEQQKILEKPSETTDGTSFTLRANIEFAEELPNIDKYHAQGIGLLRTESLYLNSGEFEKHEEQEKFYSTVMNEVGSEFVAMRLLDVGGDKYFDQPIREDNPFLGWRGIRMLLDERDLLREQLEAILRVSGSHKGQIGILTPMVSTLEEVSEVKQELEKMIAYLSEQDVEVDKAINLGVMVEVPSVAINADVFAKHVDFFSIGTNDLTQYTLAVDRGNERISTLYQQTNPAVWNLIQRTVKAARQHDIDVSVCGEMAADPTAAACLLGMGISDLSMAPASIPAVKRMLVEHSMDELQELAAEVGNAESNSQIQQILNDWR